MLSFFEVHDLVKLDEVENIGEVFLIKKVTILDDQSEAVKKFSFLIMHQYFLGRSFSKNMGHSSFIDHQQKLVVASDLKFVTLIALFLYSFKLHPNLILIKFFVIIKLSATS